MADTGLCCLYVVHIYAEKEQVTSNDILKPSQ